VKSGALTFRFDLSQTLGMIAPIWCDFPANKHCNEQTVFCLRIPSESQREMVLTGLQKLQPELLLFLRQLRKIDFEEYKANDVLAGGISISREDDTVRGIRRTKLVNEQKAPRSTKEVETLLVFQSTVYDMPGDARRLGVKQSDLRMAFPVIETSSGEFKEKLDSRLTFNFLPIRSYGLPVFRPYVSQN
jgi:hypothetical protein